MNPRSIHLRAASTAKYAGSQADTPQMSRAVLLADMLASNWRRGLFSRAEELLAEHPSVEACSPAAVRVIYEEICQKQELGQEVCLTELRERFPHLQRELEILFECQGIIGLIPENPRFPNVGEVLGEFRLLAELGRGGVGRVFLAEQGCLSERLMIVKLGPRGNQEHLNLARLQHTHIVPLYAVYDFPELNLRQLCMPCLGGATLQQLLNTLRKIPVENRTGKSLLEALPESTADSRLFWLAQGPNRRFLERASYAQAVCWIGVCLAEGLHYAHEQGLVHLDVKPSNVLLTADCQPMLLDFHLARRPLAPDGEPPEWLGGTPAFMSPEQKHAWQAFGRDEPIRSSVDARSDVYSLGLLLAAALSNEQVISPEDRAKLKLPPQRDLSRGLRDIFACCLHTNPARRYASAAGLAEDLRRHLTHRPLLSAPNRSLPERCRKWKQRHPRVAPQLLLAAVCLACLIPFGLVYVKNAMQRQQGAQQALALGARLMDQHQFVEAADAFDFGLQSLRDNRNEELHAELDKSRHRAIRAQGIVALHEWVERSRYLQEDELRSRSVLEQLEDACSAAWSQKDLLLEKDRAPLPAELEEQVKRDLLDVAILWSGCKRSLVSSSDLPAARRNALEMLDQAIALFGPSATLDHERQLLISSESAGTALHAAHPGVSSPRSAWEFYSLGRWMLRQGMLEDASKAFDQAVELRPQDFWPWFGLGSCAFRQQSFAKAVSAFSVCIALSPDNATCFFDRALAYTQQGHLEAALRDYDRALRLDPTLVSAFSNRGVVHFREGRLNEAEKDFKSALRLSKDQAPLHYNLALVYQARHEIKLALASAKRALECDPNHQSSRQLLVQLTAPLGTADSFR